MWSGAVRDRARLAGYALFFLLLVAQAVFSRAHPRDWRADLSPGPLPSADVIGLLAGGEYDAASTLLSLRLQTFDAQAGQTIAMRRLDGDAVARWLSRASELAPRSRYPTFMASRLFATQLPEPHARALLRWVDTRFVAEPAHHWAWQAFAVHVAEHRLQDKPLARELAHSLRVNAAGTAIPQWARDLEFFLLTDLDEPGAARALLGGLIDGGQLRDERALRAMLETLEEAERRTSADARRPRPLLAPLDFGYMPHHGIRASSSPSSK